MEQLLKACSLGSVFKAEMLKLSADNIIAVQNSLSAGNNTDAKLASVAKATFALDFDSIEAKIASLQVMRETVVCASTYMCYSEFVSGKGLSTAKMLEVLNMVMKEKMVQQMMDWYSF